MMMEIEKKRWRRKTGLGPHTFLASDGHQRVEPGGEVLATEQEIGEKYLPDYQLVASFAVRKQKNGPLFDVIDKDGQRVNQRAMKREAAKALAEELLGDGRSDLEAETARFERLLRARSRWLAPDRNPFPPPPVTLEGLQGELAAYLGADYDRGRLSGRLTVARFDLKEAWIAWRSWCQSQLKGKHDPLRPEDRWLPEIARCQAALAVTEAEIEEIRRRIRVAKKDARDGLKEEQGRMRHLCAFHTDSEGRMTDMDGRPVVYGDDDQPRFEDTGQLVSEYTAEAEEHKREKRRKARRLQRERAKRERV